MEIDINSREKLIAALEQAGKSQLRKKKARLREIYDSVLLAKSQDLDEKTIIQLLSAQGLHFSRSGFAVTMHRIKKDLEKEELTRPDLAAVVDHSKSQQSAMKVHSFTPIKVNSVRQSPPKTTESQVQTQRKIKYKSTSPEKLSGILRNKIDVNKYRNND